MPPCLNPVLKIPQAAIPKRNDLQLRSLGLPGARDGAIGIEFSRNFSFWRAIGVARDHWQSAVGSCSTPKAVCARSETRNRQT